MQYFGEWNTITGKRNGCGVEICSKYFIIGRFTDGISTGRAFLLQKSGDAYYGTMKDGKMHGEKGIRVYGNGDVYKGDFVQDKREGNGTYINTQSI